MAELPFCNSNGFTEGEQNYKGEPNYKNKKKKQKGTSSNNRIQDGSISQETIKSREGEGVSGIYKPKSLLLIDNNETLNVSTDIEFVKHLQCDLSTCAKVVSIFGNTGDGKSHTLNHTFFNGTDVFDTSSSQKSCTVGVWAAFDKKNNAIILDTEGLLGVSENANQRMRLLLKILALSDIVIYRTRAERLHCDMFTFLGDASEAYIKYFTKDLELVQLKAKMAGAPLCNLGPSIIIFQETHYTLPLGKEEGEGIQLPGNFQKTPEDILRENFLNIGRNPSAFSSISYVGTQTQSQPTSFSTLLKEVQIHLKNSSVRSPRSVSVIFNALVHLNEKFGEDVNGALPNCFPDEYFTCSSKCLSCGVRCESSMSHEQEDKPHLTSERCKYKAQYSNRVYVCRVCYENGTESIVNPKTAERQDSPLVGLAKYAWSGYVLECPECGVIYRSRKYWYGNKDPVENTVRTEIKHVWPGTLLQCNNQNAARQILDGVNTLANSITEVTAKPTKVVTNWVTDQVAPSYWTPNYLIFECTNCEHEFDEYEKKHHCRSCGRGFCHACAQHYILVPERGWGESPVRVCDSCFEKSGRQDHGGEDPDKIDMSELLEALDDDDDLETGELVAVKTSQNIPALHPPGVVTSRKVTEKVQSTISYLASTPLEYLVDSARPDYWVPNHQILMCHFCKKAFINGESKHHCRSCGQGFCNDCSKQRQPVPSRGWDYPVRVCDGCMQKKGPL